jgi:TolB-like protein
MNLFAELKRRNVFRVTAAYLVAAWGVMKGIDVLIRALDLPDWTDRLVLLLIIIGIVPTVIAAWALELTPEGIRLEKDVDRSKSAVARTGRKLDLLIIGMLSLIIAGLVVERVFFADVGAPPPVTVTQAEPGKSVAVLPFVDFSREQDQEWFADGLAEEILNALARTPDIMVSSRTSSFAYKGTDKDLQEIARELGVAHVLEGSIRSTGANIRITAQLIRAADGFHVWSQTYDALAEDVIGIQEDAALRIATALQTTMDPEALEDMVRVGTRSVRAYQAYIRGLALRGRSLRTGSLSDFLDSYEQFELARNIDPGFSTAHSEAAAYWKVQLNPTRLPGGSPDLTPQAILDNFLERIDLAIETATNPIDESGSKAEKATVQLRLRTAIRRYREYLEARPNDYRAWHELLIVAQLAADQESADAALATLKTAGDFDRFAATTYVSTAYRFGEATAGADYGLKALERWPNDAGLSYQTHRSLLWANRVTEAANLIARMSNASSENRVIHARQACAEGRRDDVLQILEQPESDERRSVAVEWMLLTLLGENRQAAELLQLHEDGGVPYQLASWLIFHYFDPSPFPSLMQMLERENVARPAAAEIPFACPPMLNAPDDQ